MAGLVVDRLNELGLGYELVACDPDLADTAAKNWDRRLASYGDSFGTGVLLEWTPR